MPKVEERMMKDLEVKSPRARSDEEFEQDLQLNAFERLGKDVVIIETLSIMNIVFAVTIFSLIGAILFLFKRN